MCFTIVALTATKKGEEMRFTTAEIDILNKMARIIRENYESEKHVTPAIVEEAVSPGNAKKTNLQRKTNSKIVASNNEQ